MVNFISVRKPVVILSLLAWLVFPCAGGEGGAVDVRDEGGGGFRIEVPVPDAGKTPATRQQPAVETGEVFFATEGAGQGFVILEVDTVPVDIFIDGQKVALTDRNGGFTLLPGRHYFSLFPAREVFLAYQDETPEGFWRMITAEGLPADRFALLASYEREAVRAGTRWVRIEADDTMKVSLSAQEVAKVYRRHATGAAITFFSVATVIAAAMFGSVALLMME